MIMPATFKYTQKPCNITVDISLRMCEAITDAGLCSKVNHHIKVAVFKYFQQGFFIFQVDLPKRIVAINVAYHRAFISNFASLNALVLEPVYL